MSHQKTQHSVKQLCNITYNLIKKNCWHDTAWKECEPRPSRPKFGEKNKPWAGSTLQKKNQAWAQLDDQACLGLRIKSGFVQTSNV